MPPRRKQKCITCNTTSSPVWRKTEDKKSLCNNCFLKPVADIIDVTDDPIFKIDAKIDQPKTSSRRKPKCVMCKTTSSAIWQKTEDKKELCNSCFLHPASTSGSSSNVKNETSVKIDTNAKNSTNARSSTTAKNATAKNATAKTTTAKNTAAKTTAAKTTTAKTTTAKTTTAKATTAKNTTAKTTTAKNTTAKASTNAKSDPFSHENLVKLEATAYAKNAAALNDEDLYGFNFRKSTRAKSSRYRPGQTKSNNPKFKSRRNIFKKVCFKSPKAISTPVTVSALFSRGTYFQVGDVVSCVDFKNKTFYAQIWGLMQDQYAEKSAVITWLLPTIYSPKDRFDATTYVAGPDEEIPRKLEYFELVCHAPVEYFKQRTSPYPVLRTKPESGFIWTSVGPQMKVPTVESLLANK